MMGRDSLQGRAGILPLSTVELLCIPFCLKWKWGERRLEKYIWHSDPIIIYPFLKIQTFRMNLKSCTPIQSKSDMRRYQMHDNIVPESSWYSKSNQHLSIFMLVMSHDPA
jgi:hypothetical protein